MPHHLRRNKPHQCSTHKLISVKFFMFSNAMTVNICSENESALSNCARQYKGSNVSEDIVDKIFSTLNCHWLRNWIFNKSCVLSNKASQVNVMQTLQCNSLESKCNTVLPFNTRGEVGLTLNSQLTIWGRPIFLAACCRATSFVMFAFSFFIVA